MSSCLAYSRASILQMIGCDLSRATQRLSSSTMAGFQDSLACQPEQEGHWALLENPPPRPPMWGTWPLI